MSFFSNYLSEMLDSTCCVDTDWQLLDCDRGSCSCDFVVQVDRSQVAAIDDQFRFGTLRSRRRSEAFVRVRVAIDDQRHCGGRRADQGAEGQKNCGSVTFMKPATLTIMESRLGSDWFRTDD